MPASKATEDLFPRGHARGQPFSRKDLEASHGIPRRGKKRLRQTNRQQQNSKVKAAPPKGTDILAVSATQKVEVIEAPKREKKAAKAAQPKPKAQLIRAPKEKETDTPVYFTGFVRNFDPSHGISVDVPKRFRPKGQKKVTTGLVSLCDISDDFDEASKRFSEFKNGSSIQVRIVSVSSSDEKKLKIRNQFCLTMRRQEETSTSDVKDPLITSADCPLHIGRKLRGFVRSVTKLGAFLEVGRAVRAYVKLSDLSDDFIENPEETFLPGTVVSGKVCEAHKSKIANGQVSMSLRTKEKVKKKSKEDIKVDEGDVVKCTVNRVERYGAIVRLTDSGKRALLHNSEVYDLRKVENSSTEWRVGQELTVVVVGTKDKRFKVGTKRSYFQAAGVNDEEVEAIIEENSSGISDEPSAKKRKLDIESTAEITASAEDDSDEDEDEEVNEVKTDADVDDDAEMDDDDDDVMSEDGNESDEANAKQKKTGNSSRKLDSDEDSDEDDMPVLSINHSFSTLGNARSSDAAEADDDDESETEGKESKKENAEDETPTVRKRKTAKEKKEKKRAIEAAEREIRLKEEALASNTHGPQSAEDFERMLLAEPNSSVIWIQYMAFRLSLVQVEKARAIAERALETIEVEKELERVNVWIAYINMEANYAAGSDSLSELRAAAVLRVFDRAVKRVNDPLDLHLRVVASLRELEFTEMADEIMKRAIKQFRSEKKVWIHAGQMKFQSGDAAAARKLLERSLLALEKRDHVAVIMKFSQFEYKFASIEKGRTVFESLIGNYPKRLDIWNVFLDMEIGVCRQHEEESDEFEEAVSSTRLVFERCATLELSSKKMKSVFKKWIKFENVFGDKDSHEVVLEKARQFVESKNGPTEE